MIGTTTTLRFRKKARVRDSLIREAMRLFETQGFEETTIEQITDAADVSRRTFFRYFPSKESVIFPKSRERIEAFRLRFAMRPAGTSGLAAVVQTILALRDRIAEDSDEFLLQFRLIESSPQLQVYERAIDFEWETAIAEALLEGQAEPDEHARSRARILAAMLFAMFRNVLREWLGGGRRGELGALGIEVLQELARLEVPGAVRP